MVYGHQKYILGNKESLLRTLLNKNTTSDKLFLFDNNQNYKILVTVKAMSVMRLFEIAAILSTLFRLGKWGGEEGGVGGKNYAPNFFQ